EKRHERIRANESLFDLFSVLQGALQVLVGAIMARRQDELVKLKSHGNLSPNIDPFSQEGVKAEYSLIFKVKKTGSKGVNATIER
nr:integrase [Vibrio anguillarum]